MRDTLYYLVGKKTYILAIVSAINAYLMAASVYTPEFGALIQTILGIIAGGARYQTEALGIKK